MFQGMKRGRRPPRAGVILPRMAEIVDVLPPPRAVVDWSMSVASYDYLGNDVAGCCTYSAAANFANQLGIYAGSEAEATADDVLREYAAGTGYKPGKPLTDRGQVETDLLHDWMTKGFTFGGKRSQIDGYASVDYSNLVEVRQAIDLFEGVMIGTALPSSAETQGLRWSVVSGPDGVPGDGHEMFVNGYDGQTFQAITWGNRVRLSIEWWLKYVRDTQLVLSQAALLKNGRSPAGIDFATLANAMASLGPAGS